MNRTSPLLINEPPLQVLPSLAVAVGLNEAIILQQVHYWLSNRDKRNKPYVREGHTWIYNTYPEWQEQFPFWSLPTIQRAILRLEKRGLLISRQFDLEEGEPHKYYTLNYSELEALRTSLEETPQPTPSHQNDVTPSHQNDVNPDIKMMSTSHQNDVTINRTETSSETSYREKRKRNGSAPPFENFTPSEDLKPQLSPLEEALRTVKRWPETLSPSQYDQILRTARDLCHYDPLPTPEAIRQAPAFYRERKTPSWALSWLANDWPELSDWAIEHNGNGNGNGNGHHYKCSVCRDKTFISTPDGPVTCECQKKRTK